MSHPAYAAGRAAALAKFASDFSLGGPLPYLPFGWGMQDKKERLPGMSKWVPRGAMERAFEGVDAGLDDQAISDLEGDSGAASRSLAGAGVGAALGRYGLKMPWTAALPVGGLVGAGAGLLYHDATKGQRRAEGHEAAVGARSERSRFPIKGQPRTTASESTPLTINTGGGE